MLSPTYLSKVLRYRARLLLYRPYSDCSTGTLGQSQVTADLPFNTPTVRGGELTRPQLSSWFSVSTKSMTTLKMFIKKVVVDFVSHLIPDQSPAHFITLTYFRKPCPCLLYFPQTNRSIINEAGANK